MLYDLTQKENFCGKKKKSTGQLQTAGPAPFPVQVLCWGHSGTLDLFNPQKHKKCPEGACCQDGIAGVELEFNMAGIVCEPLPGKATMQNLYQETVGDWIFIA